MGQSETEAMATFLQRLLDGEIETNHIVLGPKDRLVVFMQHPHMPAEVTKEVLRVWDDTAARAGLDGRVMLVLHEGDVKLAVMEGMAVREMGKHDKPETESNEPDGYSVGNKDDSKRGRDKTGDRKPGKHEKKNGE